MAHIRCPHCKKRVELSGNSAFVLKKKEVSTIFKREDYHPNPERAYKTPESRRREQLAYYWRNRERVLERERLKRIKVREALGK